MNAQQALAQALTPALTPAHAPGGGNPSSSARPAPSAPNSALPHCQHCQPIPAASGGAAPAVPPPAPAQIPASLGPMVQLAQLAAASTMAHGASGASWTAGQAGGAGLRGIAAGEALRGLQAACAEGAAEQGPHSSLCSLVARMGAAAETFRCIYSNMPEHARLDRARLAEDLCDALIHLLRLASVCSADVAAKWDERLAASGPAPPEAPDTRPADTPGDEARAPKRLRFSDVQRAALEALGERSAWSLPGLSREEKDAFCLQHNISKDRLQNFFNNHKPKAFRRMRSARSADANHAGSSDSGGAAGAAQAGADANPTPNPPTLNELSAQLNGAMAGVAAEAAGAGA